MYLSKFSECLNESLGSPVLVLSIESALDCFVAVVCLFENRSFIYGIQVKNCTALSGGSVVYGKHRQGGPDFPPLSLCLCTLNLKPLGNPSLCRCYFFFFLESVGVILLQNTGFTVPDLCHM